MNDIMNTIKAYPSTLIAPENWLVVALAVIFVCMRAYLPLRRGADLTPVWWRVVLYMFTGMLRKLDRVGRGRADLGFRAVVVIILAVLFAALVAKGAMYVDSTLHLKGLVAFLLLVSTMQMGAVWRLMREVSPLGDMGISESDAAQSLMRTYHLARIGDAFAARRLLIGYMVYALDKMILLPVIWYLLFGITGALCAATMAALLWQVRLMPPQSAFGETILAIEKLLGFVPNWLAGVFLSVATFVAPKAGIARAFGNLNPEKSRVSYESGGFATAVMAWGLTVTLGGPLVARDGAALAWGWIGPKDATAQTAAVHIRLALFWVMITMLVIVGGLLSAALWSRTI